MHSIWINVKFQFSGQFQSIIKTKGLKPLSAQYPDILDVAYFLENVILTSTKRYRLILVVTVKL